MLLNAVSCFVEMPTTRDTVTVRRKKVNHSQGMILTIPLGDHLELIAGACTNPPIYMMFTTSQARSCQEACLADGYCSSHTAKKFASKLPVPEEMTGWKQSMG